MDLSRGCILIARSLDESDIFQNEKWLKVWVWCVIQANHKGKNVPVNIGRAKTSVWVNRGQFIFGRNKAAEKLGMSPSTVRNIMQKLDDFGNLDIEKDTHFSIVTLSDFDFYQDMNNYKGQAEGQPEDSQRTARGQPEDTTNTPNTLDNEKNEDNNSSIPQNEFAGNEPEFYLTKKKRKLEGKRLQTFLKFWEIFNYKKDKASAADSWIDIPELTNSLVDEICEAAKVEADGRQEIINKESTPIYAQGWLTARRWEDDPQAVNGSKEKTKSQEDRQFEEQLKHMT